MLKYCIKYQKMQKVQMLFAEVDIGRNDKMAYGLIAFWGIVLIGIGIFRHIYPDAMWNLSLSRRWYVKGGEPTEFYYTNQKIGAVLEIIIGVALIICSISMSVTEIRGYVVNIDGQELKIPCLYSDIEALGYQIDSAEEIKTLKATNKNIKNSATYMVKNAEGKEFKVTFENRGTVDKVVTECELIAISVEVEKGPKIILPNGVKSGMSESEIKSIMGKGTPRGVGASAAEYRTKVNFNSYKVNIVYNGDFMNRKAKSIRIEDALY